MKGKALSKTLVEGCLMLVVAITLTLAVACAPTTPTPTPTPTPTETAGKFEILSHSMSRDKDDVPVVSIQAKNSDGSSINCIKITVEFLDDAEEVLFTSSTYEYDVAPGQTYNLEVAPVTLSPLPPIYK